MRHVAAAMIVALAFTVSASSQPKPSSRDSLGHAEGQPKLSSRDSLGEGWLLVANKGDGALGIIDPVAGQRTSACSHAAMISLHSAPVTASGFSHSTCTPARAARIAYSACIEFGSAMYTASASSRHASYSS